ncbi:MAG: endonuclease MutS2 [Planctomycetia bacterium]
MAAQHLKGALAAAMQPRAKQRAERLERHAARALDWDQVRPLYERLAPTALSLRMLRELAPMGDEQARGACARAEEAILLCGHGAEPPLAGAGDPLPALVHVHTAGRPLAEEELAALLAYFACVERLADWLRSIAKQAPALGALAVGMPDFAALVARLDKLVDERGTVRDEASPLVSRLKRESSKASEAVDAALRGLTARAEIRAVLSDIAPHRRGGRPVLAVRAKSSGRVPGIVHDRSQSGETVFIEPREVVLLGNRLVELESDLRREIERVHLEATRAILEHEAAVVESAERVGRLELALVAARYARQAGARIPRLVGREGLVLKQARHPLLVEQVAVGRIPEVVPIDLRLGDAFDLLLVTGPNTGGKTLALKTTGLAALCVRMGLPFPCGEGSAMPLFDGIVADIGDEQQIAQNLSTFSSHLARIKEGLGRATANTLVLLDELGGGTDPDEGAALSEALLEHLVALRAPTIATTHIGKLKEFAFRVARAENACVEFDPQTLLPRYRLIVGTPGESGALVVARRLGLPAKLVERARERLEKKDAERESLFAQVRHAREKAEELRSAAESQLKSAAEVQRAAALEQQAVERKSELLETEAQRTIEERVRAARARIQELRPRLEQAPAALRKELADALLAIDADLSGAALSEKRQAFLDGLKEGQFVFLPRLRQRVPVKKLDKKKRTALVLLGGKPMEVGFDEITSFEAR